MTREMRRKRQALSAEECEQVLRQGNHGVLALHGDDGYPYAVPLNYVYADGRIYFHSARQGHKLDAIARDGKASFCVVANDDLVPSEFTTYFKSVIAFGRMRVVDDGSERMASLTALTERLAPSEPAASMQAEIDRCALRDIVVMLALDPERITGKQAKELV